MEIATLRLAMANRKGRPVGSRQSAPGRGLQANEALVRLHQARQQGRSPQEQGMGCYEVFGFLGNHGMRADMLFMCSSYPGLRSRFLLSISGTLTPRNSAVSASGPATTHQ